MRLAHSSEWRASRSWSRSRYRSVPVSTSTSGASGRRSRQRAIDVGRAARVQRDQQVGSVAVAASRRDARRRDRREEALPARRPCASCRCSRRRAPARRSSRAACASSRSASTHDGTHDVALSAMDDDARRLAGRGLAAALRDSRATTLARTFDRDDWRVPQQPGVNPVAWELGHLAWFAEFWILRGPHRLDADGRVVAEAAGDAWPDPTRSSIRRGSRTAIAGQRRCPIATRSRPGSPSSSTPASTRSRVGRRRRATATSIASPSSTRTCTARRSPGCARRSAGRRPEGVALRSMPAREPSRSPAATSRSAATRTQRGFSFDNESPRRRVRVAPFEIDAAPVTNASVRGLRRRRRLRRARLVAGRGRRLAPAPGARPARALAAQPGRDVAAAMVRSLDRARPRCAGDPRQRLRGRSVSRAGPAGACRAAAEREHAAADPRLRSGRSVWEWTASAFEPYPGFVAGPYRDYSAPWFGDHRELRGGSFATHDRLHHPSYRNFFTPDRSDVFAGFRTAASR